MDRLAEDRLMDSLLKDSLMEDRLTEDRLMDSLMDRLMEDSLMEDRLTEDRLLKDRLAEDRLMEDRLLKDRLTEDRLTEDSSRRWRQQKQQRLSRLDHSKKGSVDGDIEHVVSLLNSCEQFFTTSSCSGRIILIDGAPGSSEVHKQNCVWLFVSHQKCESDDLVSGLARSRGDAVLKFEPFVLHVQCRQLEDAQGMHSVAVNSGFRNSGLTVSKTGKIIMAVRSTHGLEVPLSQEGKLLVEQEYIHFLTQIANQKMEENLRRIHRFYQSLQSFLSMKKLPGSPISQETEKGVEEDKEGKNTTTSVYKRRRKREQHRQTDCCHGDGSSSVPELEDCQDLFL
ncbi:tRNA wybutosine-synthesizing protein 3 homolog [Pempheris klunzingeri]|uniref:tRNA wybutosine-synthesizing protein 3 homolog n=1 Tax=Pempheris klunzingeri TaxID=3127111 RepID=UPI003980444E